MTTTTEEVIVEGAENILSPDNAMAKFITEIGARPEPGSIVEAPVIRVDKRAVFVDVPPFGVGIIYGREYMNARDLIKHMNIGDVITAKVVESENEDGYIELSLKEARQSLIWAEAEELAVARAADGLQRVERPVVRQAGQAGPAKLGIQELHVEACIVDDKL